MEAVPVYIGVWSDYSRAGLSRLTLTLPTSYANYLLSFLAILVSLAGTALWTVVAYAMHQYRVRPDRPADLLHVQIQTLLRNDGSPTSALADAFSLGGAWSRTPFRARRRLAPIVASALAVTALFKIAAVFVAAVVTSAPPAAPSSSSGANVTSSLSVAPVTVLANPRDCGAWEFNWTTLDVAYDTGVARRQSLAQVTNLTLAARAYARWFYSDEPPLVAVPLSVYPARRLPYAASDVACPFPGRDGGTAGRCLEATADAAVSKTPKPSTKALQLDTGLLDSHVHLGINAPREARLQFRRVLTCAPIDSSDLATSVVGADGDVTFDLGAVAPNTTVSFSAASRRSSEMYGYSASCVEYPGAFSALFPPPWNVTDSDLSVCWVMQNSVSYADAVYDPLFLATNASADGLYFADNFLNMIACKDQVQFCNNYNAKGCTSLTHPLDAYRQALSLEFNADQFVILNKTAVLFGLINSASAGLGVLGSMGLLASEAVYSQLASAPLSPTHWQREVRVWFETGLAQLQSQILLFLNGAAGPDNNNPGLYGGYLVYRPLADLGPGPDFDAASRACRSQKVAAAAASIGGVWGGSSGGGANTVAGFALGAGAGAGEGTQNFGFAALLLVALPSAGLIAMSVALEPCVRAMRRRRSSCCGRSLSSSSSSSRTARVRQAARETDSKFWLLRMALEGVGADGWRRGGVRGGSDVPVTDSLVQVYPPDGDEGADAFYRLKV